MVVIVAEKKQAGQAIADALGAGKGNPIKKGSPIKFWETTLNGEKAIILHLIGHFASLCQAKDYDKRLAKWDLINFPFIPEKYEVKFREDRQEYFDFYKKALSKADWLISATDSDREGEVIFYYLIKSLGLEKKKQMRAWMPNDLTESKIKQAFNNLCSPLDHRFLLLAGVARSVADWVIGANMTVAATVKYGNGNKFNIGRVQTAVMSLVVEREKAIIGHTKSYFWKVIATFKTPTGETFIAEHEHGNFETETEAKNILSKCLNKKGIIVDVKTSTQKKQAPQYYNTTALLSAIISKFGWNAKRASDVIQSLYDNKHISYPRTKSVYLTSALEGEVLNTIGRLFNTSEYSRFALDKSKWNKLTKRHIDDKKIESDGHVAFYPTEKIPNISKLNDDEKKVYDLIAKSVIKSIYPPLVTEHTQAIINVNGERFIANGKVIKELGWFKVEENPKRPVSLPILSKDDKVTGNCDIKKIETKPPSRYTEASLLEAMENCGKTIKDEQERELMRKNKAGLGTDGTRQGIVTALFNNGYLEKKGKSIIPTEKSMFVYENFPINDLKSAEITAHWEKQLSDIADGNYTYQAFINAIHQKVRDWFLLVANDNTKGLTKTSSDTNIKCPICGGVLKKLDWGYNCSNWKKDKTGCNFSIGKIAGKILTEAQLKSLVNRGRSGIIRGFTSKNGKKFNAELKLKNGKIDFVFVNNQKY